MNFIGWAVIAVIVPAGTAHAADDRFESWPASRSTFPSTGGGDIMIKGW